jgi:hypothetical protein
VEGQCYIVLVRPLVDGGAAFRYIARRTRVPVVDTMSRVATPLGLGAAVVDEVMFYEP